MRLDNSVGWLTRVRALFRTSNETAELGKGLTALREGRIDEAIAALHQHLNIRPRDGHGWTKLGNALKDAGRYEEAKRAYEYGCKLRPRSAVAWLRRAQLAKFMGEQERAISFFRRSIELDGDNTEAKRELQRFSGVENAEALSPVGYIEGLVSGAIFGWAVDPDRPEEPVELEFLQGGELVGSGRADLTRPGKPVGGPSSLSCGFRIPLNSKYNVEGGTITARLCRSTRSLANSPFPPPREDHVFAWLQRWRALDEESRNDLGMVMDRETEGLLLSIVMPVRDTSVDWLQRALQSVQEQFCSRWELICVVDPSTRPDAVALISSCSDKDDRVRIIRPVEAGSAISAGLENARGHYVGLLAASDALEPEATYRVLATARDDVDLIYSDEVITGPDIDQILEIVARPAFSYDYYISHPYFVHFIAVKRSLVGQLGGFDVDMNISMDVDFVLRAIEQAQSIAHIPAPLYRWRTHPGSADHEKVGAVMAATRGALERHHSRMGNDVRVSDGLTFDTFRHDFPSTGRSLIIVPTKDRLDLLQPCIASLLATTTADIVIVDHDSTSPEVLEYFQALPDRVRILRFSGPFNFSKMNNQAVAAFGGGYDTYLFANNDLEAIEPGWLEHMQGLCLRPDVGAVGALLLYTDGSIQHGGVVLNVGGPAEHVYKNAPSRMGDLRHPGYISSLVSVRDFMAVTGACLMVDADTFNAVGGFDPLLAVGFNDIDLCLRIRESGRKVLYDGHAMLYHHESATRMKSRQLCHPEDTALMTARWADLLAHPDPYFSPMFADTAPAEHIVARPIDPYAPAQIWRRDREISQERGARRTAPSLSVI